MQRDGRRGIVYREWAPAARAASLVGDFNGWDESANPCVKDDFVSGKMMREAGGLSLPSRSDYGPGCLPASPSV